MNYKPAFMRRMTIVMVVTIALVAAVFVSCKYFRGQILDGPGMERDSADYSVKVDSDSIVRQDITVDERTKEKIVGIIHDLYVAASQNQSDIDSRFACRAWCDMVAAVNKKDNDVAEIGFFNDDYWTMMQDDNPNDLEARDIQFEQLDTEQGRAMVNFVLQSSVQTVHMKFVFCRDDGDWLIHDIIRFYNEPDDKEDSFSFMTSMKDYLNESAETASEP